MLLFAYILIISTRIFKILTFFYQVIILLKVDSEVKKDNSKRGFKASTEINENITDQSQQITLQETVDVNEIESTPVQAQASQLVPRRNTKADIGKIETINTQNVSLKSPKLQMIKTDNVIMVGVVALILAFFTVFVNHTNNAVIIIHFLMGKIFFLVAPTYWILRSEEKTKFVQRRFHRLRSRFIVDEN